LPPSSPLEPASLPSLRTDKLFAGHRGDVKNIYTSVKIFILSSMKQLSTQFYHELPSKTVTPNYCN
jgi:hypothetical protein